MKNIAIMALAGAMITSVATAQVTADDLNARQLQQLRVNSFAAPAPTPVPTIQPARQMSGLYVGGTVGWAGPEVDKRVLWSNGIRFGYQANRFVALEAAVDYQYGNSYRAAGQSLFGNVLIGAPIGRFNPYVVAGLGAGFNGLGNQNNSNASLWNAGVGLRYDINQSWQIDGRYRYVDSWQTNSNFEQSFSVGVNYRF